MAFLVFAIQILAVRRIILNKKSKEGKRLKFRELDEKLFIEIMERKVDFPLFVIRAIGSNSHFILDM